MSCGLGSAGQLGRTGVDELPFLVSGIPGAIVKIAAGGAHSLVLTGNFSCPFGSLVYC